MLLILNLKGTTSKTYIGNNLQNCKLTKEFECNSKGKNCKLKFDYKYLENGGKAKYYYPNSNWLEDFELGKHYNEIWVYNSDDKEIKDNLVCDKNFKNCKRKNIFEYNSDGNLTAEFKNCTENGSDCGYIRRYEYDFNNKIADFYDCTQPVNYCGKANKYIYDYKNNLINEFHSCDNNFNNCEKIYKNIYEDNKKIVQYNCNNNLNDCPNANYFEYDYLGNMTADYQFCSLKKKNCSSAYFYNYKYDQNNNILEKVTTYKSYRNGVQTFQTASSDKYEYDYSNRLLKRYYCGRNTEDCSLEEENKYDKNGLLLESYHRYGSKKTVSKYSYLCE